MGNYKAKPCVACGTVFKPVSSKSQFCSLPCRFWAKVDKSAGPDKCWPWTAALSTTGYGCVTLVTGKQNCTHRVAYELACGRIPPGKHILHSCDNRACCNPSHLSPGTQADNAADMWSRGRQHSYSTMERGEKRHNAKLTPELVRHIRAVASSKTPHEIAKDIGVGTWNVRNVLGGKTWKHVQ